jgi:hypothetical protein
LKQVFSIKFYRFTAVACITGWGWLAYQLLATAHGAGFTVCWVKRLTGLPCPGCGISRSIVSVLGGDFNAAAQYNILGYPALLTLCVLPLWILADAMTNKTSLYHIYKKTESKMQSYPIILIVMLLVILANWSWNIWKGV